MTVTTRNYIACNALLVAVLSAMLGAGCAFSDGDPWGYVHTTITTDALAASDAFAVDEFKVKVRTIRAYKTSAGGSGAAGPFDPANPPPGYSLCHNGHCHAADGSLPSYEEVIASMAQGAAGPVLLTSREIDAAITADSATESGTGSTTSSATLKIAEQATVSQVEVELSEFVIQATVVAPDAGADGDAIELTIALPINGLRIAASTNLVVGAQSPLNQELALRLSWPTNLLDAIDLGELHIRADGTATISGTSNRDTADRLAELVAADAALR